MLVCIFYLFCACLISASWNSFYSEHGCRGMVECVGREIGPCSRASAAHLRGDGGGGGPGGREFPVITALQVEATGVCRIV